MSGLKSLSKLYETAKHPVKNLTAGSEQRGVIERRNLAMYRAIFDRPRQLTKWIAGSYFLFDGITLWDIERVDEFAGSAKWIARSATNQHIYTDPEFTLRDLTHDLLAGAPFGDEDWKAEWVEFQPPTTEPIMPEDYANHTADLPPANATPPYQRLIDEARAVLVDKDGNLDLHLIEVFITDLTGGQVDLGLQRAYALGALKPFAEAAAEYGGSMPGSQWERAIEVYKLLEDAPGGKPAALTDWRTGEEIPY